MATPGYSLAISAVDNVSSTLAKINAKLEASQMAASKRVSAAVAPWQKLGATVAQTGKLLGLDKAAIGIGRVAKGMQGMAGGALDAFRNVSRIVEPLGIITGALSLAGMYKLISAWSDFGTQLGFSAQRIGIGASQLQALQGGAQLAGVSAGALTAGLQGLGQTLYDAVGGRNSEAVGLFNQLGISFRDSAGHAKSVQQVMPQLADAIAKLKDPYAQAQVATIAFGAAGEELLPFLRLGSKGLADYTATAARYGVMNQKGIVAANDFRMAQVKVELAVRGLTNSIAEKLSPILVPLLTQMADWIAANRAWIATNISKYVGEFVTWIKGIDWKGVGQDIDGYYHKVSSIAGALGGWETTAKEVLGVIAGVWIIGMLAPLATLLIAIGKVGAAFLAMGAEAKTAEALASGAAIGGAGGYSFLRNLPGPLGLALATLLNGLPDGPEVGSGQDDALMRQFPGLSGVRSYGGGQPSSGPVQSSIFKNNNPTNLMAYPGQNYATGANGRWATYKTVADGLAGGLHQMLIDQDRGYNTISKEITRRSPPSENDTAGMIKDISGWMGHADPNKVYNLRDRAQAAAFLRADVRRETGHEPTDADIQQALNEELGPVKVAAPTAPAMTAAQNRTRLGFAGGPGRSPSGPAAGPSALDAKVNALVAGITAKAADAHAGMMYWQGQWVKKPSPGPSLGPDTQGPDQPVNLNDPKYHRADGQHRHQLTPAQLWAHGEGAADIPLPSSTAGGGGSQGKIDVHVKIDHDGKARTTTKQSGQGVGKLRVETPMQAHAA
jgi:hypothetical protein